MRMTSKTGMKIEKKKIERKSGAGQSRTADP